MLKYVVKSVSKATENNVNFKGKVITSYYGKNCGLIASDDEFLYPHVITPYYVQQYGYDRECDAKRSWIYKNPQNDESWKTDVKVVKIIIQEGVNESWCVELV